MSEKLAPKRLLQSGTALLTQRAGHAARSLSCEFPGPYTRRDGSAHLLRR